MTKKSQHEPELLRLDEHFPQIVAEADPSSSKLLERFEVPQVPTNAPHRSHQGLPAILTSPEGLSLGFVYNP